MANNMVASLRLTLNDQLTAGLNRFKQQFEGLRNLGKSLTLGKLQDGASILDKNASAARGLTSSLHGVAGAADRAWAAMKRAGSATAGWGKKTFGPMSRTEAFTGLAEGFSVVEPIRSYAGFEDIARQAAITKGLSGAAATAESNRLMAVFQKEALGTGQSSATVGEAFLDMVRMGVSPTKIESILGVHSRAATAYDISAADLGAPAAALLDTMKISEGDFGGALASMAFASQHGRFKIGDFSRFLPGIAGTAAKLGMTGRGGADILFAALETVMKNSSEPGQGATDFTDFLNYITSPMAAKSFALDSKGMGRVERGIMEKYHLTGFSNDEAIAKGATLGMTPYESIVSALREKVRGLSPAAMSEALGAYIHDKGSRDALVATLLHLPDYNSLKEQLGAVKESKVDTDFQTRMAGPQKQLDLMVEQLTQLGRMAGSAFLPILTAMVTSLRAVGDALNYVDRALPGVKDGVLLTVGGFLALSAGVAAFRVALPAITGAWSILTGILRLAIAPVRLLWTGLTVLAEVLGGLLGVTAGVAAAIVVLAAVMVAAAYDVIANWDRFAGFFEQMWQGVEDIFIGFAEFVGGLFLGDLGMAWQGIQRIWSGVGEFFTGLWDVPKQLFLDFVNTLDGWTGGAIIGTFNAIRDAVGSVIDKIHEWIELLKNGAVGRMLGLSDAKGGDTPDADGVGPKTDFSKLPAAANSNLNVVFSVDEYGRPIIRDVKSDNPSVQVSGPAINPGATLGRH